MDTPCHDKPSESLGPRPVKPPKAKDGVVTRANEIILGIERAEAGVPTLP
jgi:hypothetical protein